MAAVEDTKTVQASCICGNASHDITLPTKYFPLTTTMCHCDSCRHMTGTLAFGCVRLPPEYHPDPSLFDKLEAFVFSAKITQYFCGTCGAHVIERSTSRKGPESEWKTTFGIMSGTLKKTDCRLIGHIYVGDTRDGGLADLLPEWRGMPVRRYAGYDDQDITLPLYWKDENARARDTGAPNKLRGFCKCGGVQFWISRAAGADRGSPSGPKPEPSQTGALCNPDLAAWVRADSGRYLACHCVCNSCRGAAGQDITSWAMVPKGDITLDADGKIPFTAEFGTLRTYASSPGHERSFCSKCGAKAFYQAGKSEDTVDVAVGILDAAEGARASSWIEWQLHRVGFREDAIDRSDDVLAALDTGIEKFVKHSQL